MRGVLVLGLVVGMGLSPAPGLAQAEPAQPLDQPGAPAPAEHPSTRRLTLSAASVAAVYGAFGTWAYFSWFYKAPTMDFFVADKWHDENPFAIRGYAGGADKFGHCWFNYGLTRGTTELLVAGGWSRFRSSLVAAGLAETAFTLSEVKDGYIWGFEVGDIAANFTGAAFAVLLENVPSLDRLVDFRLQYFPSSDYRYLVRNGPFFQRGEGVDIAQDYSGQSYMLALHLGAITPLVEAQAWGWTRYVDVVAGFKTRGYEPNPEDPSTTPRQTFYLGIGLDLQAVVDHVFAPSVGRSIAHGAFEVLSIPGTTLPVASFSRFRPGPPQ